MSHQGKKMNKEQATNIFINNINLVRSIAFSCAPNKSLTDDIVHDTWIRFTENADKWEYDETKIKSLLKSVVVNVAGQYWRNYAKELPQNMKRIAMILEQKKDSKILSEYSDLEEKHLILRNCIQKLSPENRELIELFYYREKPITVLKDLLGKSVGALYTQISRVRILLHRCMEQVMKLEIRDDQ